MSCKIKLYKFRSLGDETAFDRAKNILEQGKFHCEVFFKLNDPMEGVFEIPDSSDKERLENNILSIFRSKTKYHLLVQRSRGL